MKRSLILALAGSAALVVVAPPAGAVVQNPSPAPLTSLRHLTFAFSFDSHSKVDSHVSGFDNGNLNSSINGTMSGSFGNSGAMASAPGQGLATGSERSGMSSSSGPVAMADGTISVDVMAATKDGGLVVDVSESDPKQSPVVRVGIDDQALYYGPGAGVTDEERTILHYLARDLVKADTLTAGTTWTDASPQKNGDSYRMRYTVTSVDEDAKTVELRLAGTSTANGYTSTSSGSLSYDLGTLVPLKLTLTTHAVLDRNGDVTTVDSTLSSTLRSDSFKKSS